MTRAVVAFFVLVTAGKFFAAGRDLFGDESFYWMCGQRLDVAFADHPFMTALLVRGGTELFGATPFGARFLFLVCGALLPLIVYSFARPIVGRRDATMAAGLSLCAPATAHLGVIAIPDVPLMLFGALALLGYERAFRTGATSMWLLAGLGCALALSTHYRGVLFPAALGAHLLLTRGGRRHLTAPRTWTALIVTLAGLTPVLLYNVRLDWAPLKYQGAERHGGGFDFEALLEHLPSQAAVLTPFLYVACLAVLVALIRRWRAGDETAGFCAFFSLAHLGTFLIASPVADSAHATVHWPAPGYLPLLAFVPGVVREWITRSPSRGRRTVAVLVPAIGLVGVLYVFLEWSTGVPGYGPLHRPFAGWSEAVEATETRLELIAPDDDGKVLVVADNYLLAGNLEMRLGDRVEIYLLDHPKNIAHGRQRQYEVWELDEAGLAANRGGRDALLVLDRDQSRSSAWDEWIAYADARFESVDALDELTTDGKRPDEPRFFLRHARGVLKQ